MTATPALKPETIRYRKSKRPDSSYLPYGARIGDLVERADTAAEARQNVVDAALEALLGDYHPYVIVGAGGYTALVYREPTGWCYKLMRSDDHDGRQPGDRASIYATVVSDERGQRGVDRRARKHLAQCTTNPVDGWRILFYGTVTDEDRVDHANGLTFQARMRTLDAAGVPNSEAHGIALRYKGVWPDGVPEPEPVPVPTEAEVFGHGATAA